MEREGEREGGRERKGCRGMEREEMSGDRMIIITLAVRCFSPNQI